VDSLKAAAVWARQHNADLGMSFITVIWGFHFLIMKQGMRDMPPVVFNALRFVVALPVLLIIAVPRAGNLRLCRRDLIQVVVVSLVGSAGYQVIFSLALNYTTSTNTALIIATGPAWTALFSIGLGSVALRRRLLLGISLTLVGVLLVVLGRSGARLSFSHDDMIGTLLALVAALLTACFNLINKPLLDRLGTMRFAVWSYTITAVGLSVLAVPQLSALAAANFPLRLWPYVFYSGVLSSAGGFIIGNFGLRELGPTRYASYGNFTPVLASFGGIVVLSEPLGPGLLIGAILTLLGVMLVRYNTYLRLPPRSEI